MRVNIFFISVVIIFSSFCVFSGQSKQPVAKSGEWKTLNTLNTPVARHETGFVECGGKFYLFGGRGIKPVERFDPETLSWDKLKLTPFEMHHFQAVTIGDTIYIIGCMTGGYPKETPVPNIYMYIPGQDTWIKGAEIPQQRIRGAAGAIVYDGKIYLIGGIQLGHTSGTTGWFDMYDPTTGKWNILEDAPNIRDHFHAVVAEDKLYCVGGRNTSYHTENNFTAFFDATVKQVDCYDFKTNSWTTLKTELPTGTAAGGLVHYGKNILYIGGESGQETAHAETQCFNLETEE